MTLFDEVYGDIAQFTRVEDAEEEVCELYSVYYSSNGSERINLVDASKSELEVEIKGGARTLELTIAQNPNINSERGQTGAVLWSSSVVMSEFLARRLTGGWSLHNANVVELGSGCGLVGIALHRLGARRVVLTDQKRMMKLLTRNADQNRIACTPASTAARRRPAAGAAIAGELLVAEYEWGRMPEDPRILALAVDVVVVSDCVFHELVAPLLVQTLVDVCRSRSDVRVVALVGQELRSDLVHQVFVEQLLKSFELYRVPVHPDIDGSYVLYAMWLRQLPHES
ncbi:hypothetical protein H4R23_005317 [Coemansia sp. Cherry 401B]|nr:hypothetical protein H4R23_005317 [Coemansia sp. Cherry 401B]